jgi:hypothetical protein
MARPPCFRNVVQDRDTGDVWIQFTDGSQYFLRAVSTTLTQLWHDTHSHPGTFFDYNVRPPSATALLYEKAFLPGPPSGPTWTFWIVRQT